MKVVREDGGAQTSTTLSGTRLLREVVDVAVAVVTAGSVRCDQCRTRSRRTVFDCLDGLIRL